MSLYLHGLGHFHPKNEITNQFLTDLDIGTNEAWIDERVGISSRRTVLPLDYIKQTRNANLMEAIEAAEYSHADTGSLAARMAIERAGITTNKNMVPFDPRKPTVTSGLRLGTPALTTRGMGEAEMDEIGSLIARALERHGDVEALDGIRGEVEALCRRFPLYAGRWDDGGDPQKQAG